MSTWPAYLPKPLLSQYGGGVSPSVGVTRMDSGRPRIRKRFSVEVQTEQFSFIFSDEEYAVWKSYHKYTLNYGATPFTITTPTGDGLQDLECTMVDGSYEWSKISHNRWSVSFQVEAYNRVTVDETTITNLAGLSDLTMATLGDAKDDFHEIIHTDLATTLAI